MAGRPGLATDQGSIIMKKIIIGLITLLVLTGGALALMKDKPNQADHTPMTGNSGTQKTTETVPNQIEISNFEFGPAKMVVKKGTKVTWKNNDGAKHNIAFDSGKLKGTEGELFGKGETYSYTFDEAGTYDYHCRPHPYMKATVEVQE